MEVFGGRGLKGGLSRGLQGGLRLEVEGFRLQAVEESDSKVYRVWNIELDGGGASGSRKVRE